MKNDIISFKHTGNYKKITRYFERVKEAAKLGILDKYARAGVEALSSATPVESGKTASSWGYKIENSNKLAKIIFTNSNVNDGVPIAIILQYGHATGNGGWVQGRDYINPAIQPIFDKIVYDVWKEVTKI